LAMAPALVQSINGPQFKLIFRQLKPVLPIWWLFRPKLRYVRSCGFIGVGVPRIWTCTARLPPLKVTEVVAISDLYEDLAEKIAKICHGAWCGNPPQKDKVVHQLVKRLEKKCLKKGKARLPYFVI